jgi:P4 family phage/plasmid primase-like protien
MSLAEAFSAKTIFEAATMYAFSDLSIIRCMGKKPIGSWEDAQTRRVHPDGVKAWYKSGALANINLGIVMGDVSGGLICVDLDGDEACETFLSAFPQYNGQTLTIKSGSGHGLHLYFYTKTTPKTVRVKGYELRSNGCYMIAPPSIHPDSKLPYSVLHAVEPMLLSETSKLTEWIASMGKNAPKAPKPKSERYGQSALQKEIDRVRSSANGTRNNVLNEAAFNLGQLVGNGGLVESVVHAELLAAAVGNGLNESEATSAIQSGLRAGMGKPRELKPTPSNEPAVIKRTPVLEQDVLDEEQLPNKPDDDQICLVISNFWKGKVAYIYGEWRVYENGCWVARDSKEVKSNIRKLLRKYRDRGVQVSQRRIESILAMLQDDLYVSDRKVNKDQTNDKFVNLGNGLYNLDTFELEAHSPDRYYTTQMTYGYNPEADCPVFKRFLRSSLVDANGQTDSDMILLLQEAIGYSLTARTDMKSSFWLVGKPDSGKSTLVGLLRQLAGDMYTTIDLNQLATNRFLLAGIVGKRIVAFTEASGSAPLPDALYKAMVGGSDEIWVDVKNRPGISFVPNAKFWWAMNDTPRILDRSGATTNRLKPILFNRSVPKEERDPHLPEKFARELPGIFNWAMLGYERLLGSGQFTRCEQSEAWKENYIRENDTELFFLDEKCKRSPNEKVQSNTLYGWYADFCREFGFKAKNMNQVSKDWERLGLVKQKKDGRVYWCGVEILYEDNFAKSNF